MGAIRAARARYFGLDIRGALGAANAFGYVHSMQQGNGIQMAGLKGGVSTMRSFALNLRALPKVLAQSVAKVVAPTITALGRATFSAGQNPYGDTWAHGSEGQRITLRRSGALLSNIRYVAIGTKVRVALGVKYAKYQIGKRLVFPRYDGSLPVEYVRELDSAIRDVARTELSK